MVPAGNKAKRLSSVNHTTKTIHHHHHHQRTLVLRGGWGCRLNAYVHVQGEKGFKITKFECTYFIDDPYALCTYACMYKYMCIASSYEHVPNNYYRKDQHWLHFDNSQEFKKSS